MANEIQTAQVSGLTLYCVLINSTGQLWNGSEFEAFDAASWGDYDIALTEQSTTGIYLGTIPPAVNATTIRSVPIYIQVGGSPAITDVPFDEWAGVQPSAAWGYSTRTLTSFGTLASDTATSVWGAGTRTLTSFGSLASDTATAVWASGTRTLTSFGTLVADVATAVWSAGTRTLTSFGTLVADIAAAVWTYVTRTLTSISWGPTGNLVTITVTSAGSPVSGVEVTVKNAAQTTTIDFGTTNSSGQVVFTLPDGSYKVLINASPGYMPYTPSTLTVSGTTAATCTLTARVIDAPSAPGLCVVSIYTRRNGTALQNCIVYAELATANQSIDRTLLSLQTVTDTTDVNGYASLQLIRADQFTHGDGAYRIVVKDPDEEDMLDIVSSIPNADSCYLEDLIT